MTTRVGSGSASPTEANIFSNTGITNTSSTTMATSRIDGSSITARRVLRPENVKNIGSRKITVNGSSFRVTSRVSIPRGMAMPRMKPPKTAWMPIASVNHAPRQNRISTTVIIVELMWPSRSAIAKEFESQSGCMLFSISTALG